MKDDLLTVREVATATACATTTVRKWVAAGAVASVRVGPYEAIRIPASEVERIIRIVPADES